MRLHCVLISKYIVLLIIDNHCPFFETIGVTCVLMVFCTFGTVVSLIVVHFRAAFTMGKGVGVTFSSSWGRSSMGE